MFKKQSLLAILFMLTLSACGGGGSKANNAMIVNPEISEPEVIEPEVIISPVSELIFLGKSSRSVKIEWLTDSIDTKSIVYRNNQQIAIINESGFVEFVDNGLEPDTSYIYSVQLIDDDSNVSALSEELTVKTNPIETIVPVVPEDLNINKYTSSSLELDWFDVSTNEIGYRIFSVDANDNRELLIELPLDSQFYEIDNLSFSTTYTFEVAAFNDLGESTPVQIQATTLKEPVIPAAPTDVFVSDITSNSISLSFTDNATNEDGYFIFIGENALFVDAICEGETLTECTISDLDAGETYILNIGTFTYSEKGSSTSELLTSSTVQINDIMTTVAE